MLNWHTVSLTVRTSPRLCCFVRRASQWLDSAVVPVPSSSMQSLASVMDVIYTRSIDKAACKCPISRLTRLRFAHSSMRGPPSAPVSSRVISCSRFLMFETTFHDLRPSVHNAAPRNIKPTKSCGRSQAVAFPVPEINLTAIG